MGRLQEQKEKPTANGKRVIMALTREFRETVQARVRRDAAFREGLLSDAVELLLAGEVPLGRELLRDYINATVGFPKLAARTGIHAKTIHRMFGPRGNPTARNLFEIVACLQRAEGVHFEVRPARGALRSRGATHSRAVKRVASASVRG